MVNESLNRRITFSDSLCMVISHISYPTISHISSSNVFSFVFFF